SEGEFGAGGDQPTLLQLVDRPRVRREGADGGGSGRTVPELLARFIGRGAVALKADDPATNLPVAAALEAADEARQIKGIRNRKTAGNHRASPRAHSKRKGACAGREAVASA